MDNAGHSAPHIKDNTRPPQRHRALIVHGMAALLCIVVAVPLLRMLTSTGAQAGRTTGSTSVHTAPSPTVTVAPPEVAALSPNARDVTEVSYVNSLISQMSLQEEIGQMIQVSFWGEKSLQPWMLDEIARDHVGSVILYGANIQTVPQTRAWVQAMQARASIPLFMATDLEGGAVNRLAAIAPHLPSAADMREKNSPDYARQVGKREGDLLYSMGITMDFAPVVDVQNVPNGAGVLTGRTFGSTPQQVTSLAGAYLEGLQDDHHVVGCLKHFPGLGAVPVDPHQTLYTLHRSLADLRKIDWAPYTSLLASGNVDMVMSTHVILSAVDPTRPATLSKAVITSVLRQQMHFDGVIETDAIYMLESHYPLDQIILQAAQAGNDIISAAYTPAVADREMRVLVNAVKNGTLSRSQVDSSVRRILLLKLHYGLLKVPAR
ncbi:MAG: glycoside hydrolase family 3 N-terminal domain-containing protein [Ktedonobacterales bacterium]